MVSRMLNPHKRFVWINCKKSAWMGGLAGGLAGKKSKAIGPEANEGWLNWPKLVSLPELLAAGDSGGSLTGDFFFGDCFWGDFFFLGVASGLVISSVSLSKCNFLFKYKLYCVTLIRAWNTCKMNSLNFSSTKQKLEWHEKAGRGSMMANYKSKDKDCLKQRSR